MKINPKRAIIATQIITAVDVIILNWLMNSILSGNISSEACNRRSFLSLLRLLLSFPWSLQPSENESNNCNNTKGLTMNRIWQAWLWIDSNYSDFRNRHITSSYCPVTLPPTVCFTYLYNYYKTYHIDDTYGTHTHSDNTLSDTLPYNNHSPNATLVGTLHTDPVSAHYMLHNLNGTTNKHPDHYNIL